MTYTLTINLAPDIEPILKILYKDEVEKKFNLDIGVIEKINFANWISKNKIQSCFVGDIRWRYNEQYLLSWHLYNWHYLKEIK